ncbi:hypothetical protein [Pantoea sp. OXWO6B1]|uniref:hypothetical protein n=1 Tax=Pantoea sp. OXWO6B1 TaxID=1835724 RepID=UPI0007C72CE4|nr:hypothetical protein [Pantoea sp. OXWO6B1]OAD97939.1 hypothetical protein A6A26_23540 [Pantoea sp. OXWO6B1]
MTLRNVRENRIRLCSLRVRYRQAWRSQADSNTLAALLRAIESVHQSLKSPECGEKTLNSDASGSNNGGQADA